jgi:hypothetical protein
MMMPVNNLCLIYSNSIFVKVLPEFAPQLAS